MPKQITLFEESPLHLYLGGAIRSVEVAYQCYGKLNEDKSNVILLCHALTGNAEPYIDSENEKGWWQDFIGHNLAFDTSRYFFICSNVLGGCQGTTGPTSINPDTGKPYAGGFPIVTIQDMVSVQKALLDYLAIPHLYAVIGGSFGGVQATQWAIQYPDYVSRVINLCSSLTLSAEAIGFNHIMRQAIVNDPHFKDGNYDDGALPLQGLKLARMVGMLTYRTHTQLTKAFGREVKQNPQYWQNYFQVESYLSYQGEKFLNRFDANSYLRLIRALDLYDPALGYANEAEALARISADYTLIAVSSDQLFKITDMYKTKTRFEKCGVKVNFYEIYSDFGHDSFLVDYPFFESIIKNALS